MKHLRDLYTKALEDYEKELIKRQELEERINETIEYIKSKKCKYDGYEITTQLYENEINQLLNILEGRK